MNAPQFVVIDIAALKAALVANYETITGKVLQPAQLEQLIFNAMAYREGNILAQIQSAATQNLVRFAVAPILDYLGELVGVTRLGLSSASCRLTLTLVNGHGPVVIPSGMRVATTDNQVIFEIDENTPVAVGVNTVTVTATCQTEGTAGNNYAVGTVTQILDPQAYISAATNADVTAGGSDVETDEQLRTRIMQAPASFSVAGPTGAYKYWARTANSLIIDVAVNSPAPGSVNIYPLVTGGVVTPQEVLDDVYAVCNDNKIRPLTDFVNVYSPVAVQYSIAVNLVLFVTADQTTVLAAVNTALANYIAAKVKALAQDVVVSEIIAICKVDGVYDVEVVTPAANLTIGESEFAQNTGISVNVTGISEG